MNNLIDNYLVFRATSQRDPAAFARLYDRYVAAIYRFVVLKLPSHEDAQDLTAETFTKFWQYLQAKNEVRNARALLYRIARNLIVDFYRQRDPVISADLVTLSDAATSTLVVKEPSDGGSHQRSIERRAEFTLVLAKIERLKEDYRDVLVLRLVDDLPFDVIADILEKKSGHVRVIYHRALKALNELNEPE